MDKKKALRKNPNMVTRTIGGETILLPIYKTSDDINCVYSLNGVASDVWSLINGKRSLTDIKTCILKKYDEPAVEIEKELNKFFKELSDIRAIIS